MMKFGEPEEMTISGNRAAHLDYQGEDFEGITWLIEYQEGTLIAVQMLAARGEAELWRPTVLSIAESIRSTG